MTPTADVTVTAGWAPVRGVVFDYHCTLAHGGDPADWLDAAWTHLRRPGTPRAAFPEPGYAALLDFLDHIWEHAGRVDPHGERDRGPERHRAVFDAVARLRPELDPGRDAQLAEALYATMLEVWAPYPDAAATLGELRARGIRTAVLSNMGLDLRPVLDRQGLGDLLDAVVLSWECGELKPQPGAFEAALAALGLPAGDVLMVGDNSVDDAGAARVGMRTLLLPRSYGPGPRGLGAVLRLA